VSHIATLETPRLLLRPLALSDAAQIQEIFPQWEIVRYLASYVPWPYPPDGALTFCRDVALPAMERGDEWTWTLRLKDRPATLIGVITLMNKQDDNRGFWMDPRFQRRGLMTEACDAVTDYWFNVLKKPVLRVPKAIANVASRRVSEKQGMRLIGTTERDYVSGRLPAEVWEITAEEWARGKRESG
jgi:[ribosomal protein S5]-alanine N-acetyltransferase